MTTSSLYTNKLELYTCAYTQVIIYQKTVDSFGISSIDNRLNGQQHTYVLEYTPSHVEGSKGVVLAVDSHKLTDKYIPCLIAIGALV